MMLWYCTILLLLTDHSRLLYSTRALEGRNRSFSGGLDQQTQHKLHREAFPSITQTRPCNSRFMFPLCRRPHFRQRLTIGFQQSKTLEQQIQFPYMSAKRCTDDSAWCPRQHWPIPQKNYCRLQRCENAKKTILAQYRCSSSVLGKGNAPCSPNPLPYIPHKQICYVNNLKSQSSH